MAMPRRAGPRLLYAALALGAFAIAGPAGAQGSSGGSPAQADEGSYLSAADLKGKVAKLTDGLAIYQAPTGPGAMVLLIRRDGDGEVEVHTKVNDELIAREGRATIHVGGTVEGAREIAPNELRGGKVTGGRTYTLNPGDIIWIPAGSPHQMFVERGASFSYMAVKFDAKPAP